MSHQSWSELLDYLMSDVNSMPEEQIAYTIRHDGIENVEWFLKDVDIPVDDDKPTIVTWTKELSDSLMFGSKEMIIDFATVHMVPRPCSIIKIKATRV